jgi:hypothetical protein
MIIAYTATDAEDTRLERAFEHLHISNWFNPEENYYVLETEDSRVTTILAIFGIDFVVSDTESPKNNP